MYDSGLLLTGYCNIDFGVAIKSIVRASSVKQSSKGILTAGKNMYVYSHIKKI